MQRLAGVGFAAGEPTGGMDGTEINKILAALLIAGIVFALGGVLGGVLIQSRPPAKLAFVIPGARPPSPILALLTAANPLQGRQDAAAQCGGCHSFEPSGTAIVGPNLYGIVDAPIGQGRGYDFSDALASRHGRWTFAALDLWLKNPSKWAPGTKMGYAGISDDTKRADIIDYLRTLSPSPVPIRLGSDQAAR